jgi:hypothetical protein
MNDFDPLSQEERNVPFEVGGDVRKDKPRDPRPFVRSSRDAPPPPARHPALGVPIDSYLYTDEHGAPSLFVQRFKFPDAAKKKRKRKVFIQWSLRQDGAGVVWVSEGFPDYEQLPLYNLPEIMASAPDRLIVLVEGEGKVGPARVIFEDHAVVTTAAMGAGSFPRTNATPVARHPVLIWRDNDTAGERHQHDAAKVLAKIDCKILAVDVEELVKIDGGARGVTHDPVGWDCADALLEWSNPAALRAKVLELAKPLQNESDPLADLVERTAVNPGAPFEAEALARLTALKKQDPAAFEILRSRLKKVCRVTELDKNIEGESERGPTQAEILIGIATKEADLFHASDDTAFADVQINGHRETWSVRMKGFRRWLTRKFFEVTDGAPSTEAMQQALNLIEARAHFDGPERAVHVRVAGLDGKLYLDLCDREWRAIEIDDTGWRIIDTPPVRFRRAAGMKPLPVPVAGGSINDLLPFLNLKPGDPDKPNPDFVLTVAWLLAALRSRGPYPVQALAGEHGVAKSTFTAILRALIDPNSTPLRALPREDRDLFIAATNSYVLAFDNVSGLRDWISDTLCRLATGGGFSTRQLYTDQDEILFEATRPIILNGIEEIVTRPDLIDRAIILTLEPIAKEKRRPEEEFWAEFETTRPVILGALLDAVATGFKRLPNMQFEALPRMADFARWAAACETAMWPEGTFMAAYAGNIESSVDSALEAHAVGTAVLEMMASLKEWSGTATTLLATLTTEVGETISHRKSWPKNPKAMSGSLRRASPLLRDRNIDVRFEREGHNRKRSIHILKLETEGEGNFASASSAGAETAPAPDATYNDFNAINRTRAWSQTDSPLRAHDPALRPQGHFAPAEDGLDADANEDATANDADADGNGLHFAPAANKLGTNDNLGSVDHADAADANFSISSALQNEGISPASSPESEIPSSPAKPTRRILEIE